jgi:NADPH:quinone reductase-like Zn-dependent oxidoreductase
MRAMVLSAPGVSLQMVERADPMPGDGEIRVKVRAVTLWPHFVISRESAAGKTAGLEV